MKIKETKFSGMKVFFIPTTKFKGITVSVRLNRKNFEKEIEKRSLLPFLLHSGSEKYPLRKLLARHLKEINATDFFINSSRIGLINSINISLTLPHHDFIKLNDIYENCFAALNQFIFHPNVSDNKFSDEILNENKRLLIEKIEATYNNKTKYSMQRLYEIMYQGEIPFLTKESIEKIKNITGEGMYDYWQDVIKNDSVEVYVIGDVLETEFIKLIKKYLPFKNNLKELEGIYKNKKKIEKVKEISETQNVSQAKLNIGYRSNVNIDDEEFFAMNVFNAIFGGIPNSVLFTNIREKKSYCYSIYSKYDALVGNLIVHTGIDPDKKDKVIEVVDEELEKIINGDFSSELLEQAKLAIINSLKSSLDTYQGPINYYFRWSVAHKFINPDEYIKKINDVTFENVRGVAKKLIKDSVFFLTGGES